MFLYNPYEIKAYVYGTTELVIPFSELKEIAKPNSLLSHTN
ncbi:RsiV family protein [Pedobacter steynii]